MATFLVITHENQTIWAVFIKGGTVFGGQNLRVFSNMVLGATD